MRAHTGAATLFTLLAACMMPASSRSATRPAAAPTAPAEHDEVLRRAQVWTPPPTAIENARPGENPKGPDAFARNAVVTCRFQPAGIAGSTPKFDCELGSGEKVKVKYGRTNPEVYTEVAATRLLGILGFPTDRMYVVERVRCFGCPPDPFEDLQCLNDEGASLERCFPQIDYARFQDFDPAVIERPVKGRRVETGKVKGWSWEELEKVDPSAGGATRAQIDALRLLAVFLGHWDNKSKNQRLICLGEPHNSTSCAHPFAMVQDLGATFGPDKLNLAAWAKMPVWADAPACRVSMQTLPYGGSTFPDVSITEAGRKFLADRLGRLSNRQIRDLFEGARVSRYPHKQPDGHNVGHWARAFEDKVRAIADRPPCPPQP